MEVFNSIVELLKSNGIDFSHLEHEATLTSEDSARVRADALSSGAKAILLKVQDNFAIFVFSAAERMDTKLIKHHFKSIGRKAKKIRFATAEELLEKTGLVPGSVPPFGRPILEFELFVDPSLLENERIAFNAGSLTNSLNVKLKDYIEVAKPSVFDFTSVSDES